MLYRRQIKVQRDNLVSMCRIAVKCLLDYACLYTDVNDESEEFLNFCAVFEQLVSHRLKPFQKKSWLPGIAPPRFFWDVLLENHNKSRALVFQSCIPTIEAIETIKSPKAKLRAFIRVALMEKRLSDYLSWLLSNTRLIWESYFEGAIMASEDAAMLCAELMGLNAIDFNFCLKGTEEDLLGPLEISYSPFLKYKQSLASQSSDEIEMLHLSGKEAKLASCVAVESSQNDLLRLQSLEQDLKHVKEQKDYLEELLRLRERQLTEANSRIENMAADWQMLERSREKERLAVDACVIELQGEIAKLRKSNDSLRSQLAQYKQRLETRDGPFIGMNGAKEATSLDMHVQMDHVEKSGTDTFLKKDTQHISSDQKSVEPGTPGEVLTTEDPQSLMPLIDFLSDMDDLCLKEDTVEEILTCSHFEPLMETSQTKERTYKHPTLSPNKEMRTSLNGDDCAVNLENSSKVTEIIHLQDQINISQPVTSFVVAESFVVSEKADISNAVETKPSAEDNELTSLNATVEHFES